MGPLGSIPLRSDQYSHKLGYTRNLTYNSRSKMHWPSDLKIWSITLTVIVIPSFLCLYITIWSCKNYVDLDLTARYVLTVIYLISLFLCLWAFFMVSFTEPGILPSVFMNTKIQNIEVKKVNTHKEYYVEYKNRQELNETMDMLNLRKPVDKYYSLNKFKYLPARGH